jgi:hypothetical protein
MVVVEHIQLKIQTFENTNSKSEKRKEETEVKF